MLDFKKIIALSVVAMALAGCSSDGAEIEPSALVSIVSEKSVTKVWSQNIGSNFGDKYHQLTPGVAASSIIVTDVEGKVSSYDLQTGKKQWSVDLDTAISSGVGANKDVAIVATYTGDVIALSATTGAINWQVSVGGEVVSQAQLNDKLTVLQMVNGDIIALDLLSGEQLWAYSSNQPKLTLRGNSSPLVALDATLAGLDNGKFIALDNVSGNVLWEHRVNIAKGKSDIERLTDVDGKPILYKNVLYVPGYRGNLTAINPFNAQVLWRKEYSSYRGLAAANDSIFLSSDQDIVHGISAQSAAELWRQDLLLNRTITTPATLSNQVVVGDVQGYLHFLSQEDGRFVARYKLGGALVGDMLVKGDLLYVLSNNGRLTALSIK
ncbi:MAG: outer membrane protein assembly factor BamB [Pseudomonadales bacterium]|nr:outer membrane protein assembly factor BamB [Pseudomonadales bacterium]NRA16767.1 outer membrane protein assembly factor BamB [Oceanospirillaceae bacterium]